MIQLLETTLNKYKNLKVWQKILLFLPLVIIAILCLLLFFVKLKNKSEDVVKYHKETINKDVEEKLKEVSKLAETEKKLKAQQQQIKEEIEKKESNAKEIIKRIDSAANNADADELKRIQSELRSRARTRRTGKS